MRHRETLYSDFDQVPRLYYKTYPGDIVVDWADGLGGTRHFKSIDDSETPNYSSLLKCGKFLPLNSVTIYEERINIPTQSYDIHSVSHGSHIVGQYAGLTGLPTLLSLPPIDSSIIDSVVLAAASNASAAPLDLLTEVFQAREDMELLHNIWRTFHEASIAVAKNAVLKFRKNPWKEFQSLWLEARFGVRPMMYLFADTAKAYRKLVEKHDFNRGKSMHEVSLDATDYLDGGVCDNYYAYGKLDEKITGKRTYRGCAYTSVDGWTNSIGIDPVVTAWELTRFSFVVDWFCNVSAWIATVRPSLLGDFLGVQYSIKDEYEYTRTYNYISLKDDFTGSYGPLVVTKKVSKYIRAPSSVSLPHFDPYLDPFKVVDLAALFLGTRKAIYQILLSDRRHVII